MALEFFQIWWFFLIFCWWYICLKLWKAENWGFSTMSKYIALNALYFVENFITCIDYIDIHSIWLYERKFLNFSFPKLQLDWHWLLRKLWEKCTGYINAGNTIYFKILHVNAINANSLKWIHLFLMSKQSIQNLQNVIHSVLCMSTQSMQIDLQHEF